MLHCFLLLSNLLCFLQLKKTIHDFFSSNLVKLDLDLDPDPDPHVEKLPDPDPHKEMPPGSGSVWTDAYMDPGGKKA